MSQSCACEAPRLCLRQAQSVRGRLTKMGMGAPRAPETKVCQRSSGQVWLLLTTTWFEQESSGGHDKDVRRGVLGFGLEELDLAPHGQC